MTDTDVACLVSLVRSLWPGMQWTDTLASLFAERARRVDISYDQARAAICELRANETHPVRTPHVGTLVRAIEALDPAQARRSASDADSEDPRTWPPWRVWAHQMRCPPDLPPEDVVAQYALAETRRHEVVYGIDPQWPTTYRAAYAYAWHLWHQGLVETAREAIACARARYGRVPDWVFQDGVMMERAASTESA